MEVDKMDDECGRGWKIQTSGCAKNRSRRCGVQHDDDTQWYCSTYLKDAGRVDLGSSYHKTRNLGE